MVCILFTHDKVSTTSTAGGQATELVSKWICKKVTKYLLMLHNLREFILYFCIIENVVHKATCILMAAFV